MTPVLVLVDLQNDYFPGGAMELVGADEAVAHARIVLKQFRTAGRPVVHVQHIATRPGATFFLPGTAGAEIHPSVYPLPEEPVVVKHFPNSFRETDLEVRLRALEAEELVVCGMMTHMCIDATVRAAGDLGFGCTLLRNACATRDLSHAGETAPAAMVQTALLAALGAAGARVCTAEEYLGSTRL